MHAAGQRTLGHQQRIDVDGDREPGGAVLMQIEDEASGACTEHEQPPGRQVARSAGDEGKVALILFAAPDPVAMYVHVAGAEFLRGG